MKISEMTNDQATDALIRLSAPFESICNDPDLISALEKLGGMGQEPIIKVVGTIIPDFARVGLKKHRMDLYEIVSALTMTPVSQVGRMNFKDTIKALQESYDDILRDFFSSSSTLKRIAVRKLSSSLANTGGTESGR